MSQNNDQMLNKMCLDFQQWKAIDISLPIFENMAQYPGDPGVSIIGPYSALPEGSVREFCYYLNISTQTGTHIQAPHYFIENGHKISDFSVSSFRFIAHIVDLSEDPDAVIAELTELRKTYDMDERALIFKTGYSDSYLNNALTEKSLEVEDYSHFIGQDTHPFITMGIAKILSRMSIGLVGIDALGFEPPESTKFEVNRHFCKNGIFILEGLHNLAAIQSRVFLLEAYPLRILGVEGTPCRAVALMPETGCTAQSGHSSKKVPKG